MDMNQNSLSYIGVADLILLQLLVAVFGFDAVAANPFTAAFLGLFGLGGVAFVLAGLGIEPGGASFRLFAAFGYFSTAVAFVGLTVLGRTWESPTNLYPDIVMIAMLVGGGLLLVRMGIDVATDARRIVTIEPRSSNAE